MSAEMSTDMSAETSTEWTVQEEWVVSGRHGAMVRSGVELDAPKGKHDGKVRGQRYFGPTSPRKGVLVKVSRLRPAA